jgi:hypothetical protein
MRPLVLLLALLAAGPAVAGPALDRLPPPPARDWSREAERQRIDAAQAQAETRLRLRRLEQQRAYDLPPTTALELSRDRRLVQDAVVQDRARPETRTTSEIDAWLDRSRPRR